MYYITYYSIQLMMKPTDLLIKEFFLDLRVKIGIDFSNHD